MHIKVVCFQQQHLTEWCGKKIEWWWSSNGKRYLVPD